MSFYYYLDYCLFSASRAFKYHLHSYVSYSIVSIPLLHTLGTIIIIVVVRSNKDLPELAS